MPDRDGLKSGEFWKKLLKRIDAELTEPHEFIIVGGAAIGLCYAKEHVTADVDTVWR